MSLVSQDVSLPLGPELFEYSDVDATYVCRGVFAPVRNAYNATMVQAAVILAGLKTYEGPQPTDYRLPSRGFGQVARVECYWDDSIGQGGSQEYRGMIIFTSGAGETTPIIHYVDALLGYGGSGPALGRFILEYCGIPAEMLNYAEDELEHHDYRMVFSREATFIEDGVRIARPMASPDQEWRILHRQKWPRELAKRPPLKF